MQVDDLHSLKWTCGVERILFGDCSFYVQLEFPLVHDVNGIVGIIMWDIDQWCVAVQMGYLLHALAPVEPDVCNVAELTVGDGKGQCRCGTRFVALGEGVAAGGGIDQECLTNGDGAAGVCQPCAVGEQLVVGAAVRVGVVVGVADKVETA